MECPSCGKEIDTVYINAPATLVISGEVGAEVELWVLRGSRSSAPIPNFRLDTILSREDLIEHYDLEIGSSEAEFFCMNCNEVLDKEEILRRD